MHSYNVRPSFGDDTVKVCVDNFLDWQVVRERVESEASLNSYPFATLIENITSTGATFLAFKLITAHSEATSFAEIDFLMI